MSYLWTLPVWDNSASRLAALFYLIWHLTKSAIRSHRCRLHFQCMWAKKWQIWHSKCVVAKYVLFAHLPLRYQAFPSANKNASVHLHNSVAVMFSFKNHIQCILIQTTSGHRRYFVHEIPLSMKLYMNRRSGRVKTIFQSPNSQGSPSDEEVTQRFLNVAIPKINPHVRKQINHISETV